MGLAILFGIILLLIILYWVGKVFLKIYDKFFDFNNITRTIFWCLIVIGIVSIFSSWENIEFIIAGLLGYFFYVSPVLFAIYLIYKITAWSIDSIRMEKDRRYREQKELEEAERQRLIEEQIRLEEEAEQLERIKQAEQAKLSGGNLLLDIVSAPFKVTWWAVSAAVSLLSYNEEEKNNK